ncbi:hypothetical protein DPEC_G00008560 [Dallia pectoralis]|uniref:Uncharacterized protein n=1 Tax=Dallia pectoralis TaxID=75939 RepID=A0ACC2HLK4_DALPE|nr:hypothetical protein DPEC_G00008560 [Dallia pectoralis]
MKLGSGVLSAVRKGRHRKCGIPQLKSPLVCSEPGADMTCVVVRESGGGEEEREMDGVRSIFTSSRPSIFVFKLIAQCLCPTERPDPISWRQAEAGERLSDQAAYVSRDSE